MCGCYSEKGPEDRAFSEEWCPDGAHSRTDASVSELDTEAFLNIKRKKKSSELLSELSSTTHKMK